MKIWHFHTLIIIGMHRRKSYGKPNYVLGNPATPENICPGDNINYTESIFEPYTDEKHTDGVIYFPME